MGGLPTEEELANPAARYSKDYGEQWAYQACKPVAISIFEAVQNARIVMRDAAPIFDETNWSFTIQFGEQEYRINVSWVSISKCKREDSFALTVMEIRG